MASYSVTYRGMDGRVVHRFNTLEAVQKYVKDRWEGVDYMRGMGDFHNDYGYFTLSGCRLADLGSRRSLDPNDPGFWEWDWKQLGGEL